VLQGGDSTGPGARTGVCALYVDAVHSLTSPRPPSVNFSGDTAVTDAVITRARRSDRSDDLVETIPSCLGAFLREWRGRRRMSQLALALEAGISARQFSFIETGRAVRHAGHPYWSAEASGARGADSAADRGVIGCCS
jgi:hypothetical protein